MSWNNLELAALLTQDVDMVVDRARSLVVTERTVALRDSLILLGNIAEPLDRLKLLLFVQTLLAFIPDGKLSSSLSENAVDYLADVVTSTLDASELKRSALNSLALILVKAKDLSTAADARFRAAFAAAKDSHELEISDFAQRALESSGILASMRVTA